jgi:glucose/mannose transport system permease protein
VSGRVALHACLLLGALVCLLPLYVVAVTALKPLEEILHGTLLALPSEPTFEPIRAAWSSACIGTECHGLQRGLLNSLRMALPAATISVCLGAVNGYALTMWRLPGAHALFALLLAANVLPYQLVLLPMAVLLRQLGLFGTTDGLVLVHVAYGMPYVTLLFRNFYLGVPDEIVAAARLDGGRFWSIFLHVVLPLSRPMIAVAAALQFSAIWNDYLFGLIFGGRAARVTVMLNNLFNGGLGGREYNVNMAGLLITAAPALLVYLLAGRWLVRGLAAGALR